MNSKDSELHLYSGAKLFVKQREEWINLIKIAWMSQLLLSIFSSKILCSDGCHVMVSNNKSNIKTIYLKKNLKKYSYVGKNLDDCQLPDVLI